MGYQFNPFTGQLDITSALTGNYTLSGSMVDDGTQAMPTMTKGGIGMLVVGDDEERAFFSADSAGNVTLMMASENIVANADTDGKFCIGTSVANPLTLKNRLGAAKVVTLQFWYT